MANVNTRVRQYTRAKYTPTLHNRNNIQYGRRNIFICFKRKISTICFWKQAKTPSQGVGIQFQKGKKTLKE